MKISAGTTKPKLMPLVAQPQPPIAPKHNRSQGQRRSVRWGLMLLWFMRILAALWMLLGVMMWLGILQVAPFQPIDLTVLPLGDSAMVVFFAVFDLVAAVGLWLAAPWGGVLWLVAALAQIAQSTLRPTNFWDGYGLDGLVGLLILLYFLLSYLAARELDETGE